MGRKSKAQLEAEKRAKEHEEYLARKAAQEERKRQEAIAATFIFQAMSSTGYLEPTIKRFANKINYHLYSVNLNWRFNKNRSCSERGDSIRVDREAAYEIIDTLSIIGIKAEPKVDTEKEEYTGVEINGTFYPV